MNRKRIVAIGTALAAAALAWWFRPVFDPAETPSSVQDAKGPDTEAARKPAAQPSPSPVAARPSPSASATPLAPNEEALDAYLRSVHPGPWTRQRFDGQPVHRTSIHGGSLPGAGKDRESAAALARTISRFLGVDPLLIQPESGRTDSGPRSVTFEYQQQAQGYEVFDGRMTVLARTSDGAVYMVNSDLRTPDPVDPQPRVSIEDAQRTVEEKYAGKEAEIARSSATPVIWADSRPHELAWRFSVELPAPNPDRLEVLVGASSGRIVLERSTLLH